MYLFNARLNKFVWQNYWYLMIVAGCLSVTFVLTGNILFGVAFIFICYATLLVYGAAHYNKSVFADFAKLHNFTYIGKDVKELAINLEGLIFRIGTNQRLDNIVVGKGEVIATLAYDIKISENHYQTFFWTVLCIDLPAPTPHIYLDSRHDFFTAQPELLANCERVDLEGDFPDHFNMYMAKGSSTESLTILSPDVMALLVDYSREYSIELLNSRAVYILDGILSDPNELEGLHQQAQKLVKKISPELKRMSRIP